MMIGTGIAAQALKAGSACLLEAKTEVVAWAEADGEGWRETHTTCRMERGLPAR